MNIKFGAHTHLCANGVHHLDVQKHSAEGALELQYAPEGPGLDLLLHGPKVCLDPVKY